jgi:PII-like signaling protein
MLDPGPAKKLVVYINLQDLHQGIPLYQAILRLFHQNGCAGATASKGLAGFGTTGAQQTTEQLNLINDLPVRIELIEKPETIAAILPQLQPLVKDGIIEVQDTYIAHHAHHHEPAAVPAGYGVSLEGHAMMLRIYVDQSDRYEGQPLFEAIIKRLKKLDIAGATVVKGSTGYGAKSRVRRRDLLVMGDDPPMMITVVDIEERIRQILPALKDMVEEGLVLVSEVEIIKYGHMLDDQNQTLLP